MTDTLKKQAATAFLLALAAGAVYLCYLIARPFLAPIVAAIMLAIVFHPLHDRLASLLRFPSLAAGVSTAIVFIVVTVPAVLLAVAITRDLQNLAQAFGERSAAEGGWVLYLTRLFEGPLRRVTEMFSLSPDDVRATLFRWGEQASQAALATAASVVTNLFSFLFSLVVVFISLFFFFREGRAITARLPHIVPMRADRVARLLKRINDTMLANAYGGLAVGIAQGSLTALAFWVLGLPSPILWGLVAAFSSLIPVVGSALVWGPAALSLMLSGEWGRALVLIGWGAAVVGQVDVLVRPYVVSRRVRVHTLLIFFATLGGVEAFGLMGLFLGPVILSVTMAVLDMLREPELAEPAPAPADASPAAAERLPASR